MKNTKIYIILSLLSFTSFSCESKKTPDASGAESVPSSPTEAHPFHTQQSAQTLMEHLALIEGTWINKEYYTSILKHKSPYKATLKNPYYLIYIKKDQIKGNMISIYDYDYGQTEASNISYYVLKNGSLKYVYNTFDGETIPDNVYGHFKQIRVNSDKTELCVLRNDNQRFCFRRIADDCLFESFDCEIDQFIISSILKESYKVIDNKNNIISNKIIIDRFGVINGLNGYSRVILWSFFREMNNVFKSDILEFVPNPASAKKLFELNSSGQPANARPDHKGCCRVS